MNGSMSCRTISGGLIYVKFLEREENISKFDENKSTDPRSSGGSKRLSNALNGNGLSLWVLETLLSIIKKYFSIQVSSDGRHILVKFMWAKHLWSKGNAFKRHGWDILSLWLSWPTSRDILNIPLGITDFPILRHKDI